MINHLVNQFNETETANGAIAYKSTQSSVLDLFAQGGALRASSDTKVYEFLSKAFSENDLLSMKTVFYLRDILEGQGERRFFKLALRYLASNNKDSLLKNLNLIPKYGRWDDLWCLLDTDLKKEVVKIVSKQLDSDKKTETPSLLAKWMPSENASSKETKRYANILTEELGLSQRAYRKTISSLRKKIGLVETKITTKNYGDIDYAHIPSLAGMKYRQAFFRNDLLRYGDFLDSLSNGEVKINANTLYPSDIVSKILGSYYNRRNDQLFEGMWSNLPDFIGENKEESLVMADVSGSMTGKPLEVSISLAMYIAERNESIYKDYFMTFSERPELVKIQGQNIVEKVKNISKANWGMSTDIEKALNSILDAAVRNNLNNSEMVKKLYIVSDMQFNRCVSMPSANIFDEMRKRFNDHGYDFPNIVFWNVNSHNNIPMTMNEYGVQLVSGYSPSILKSLLSADGMTPYDFMLQVINSERYEEVTA